MPSEPPSHASAVLFYAGMEFELSSLEKALNSAALMPIASIKHPMCMLYMYKTVQRDVPAQVDSLAQQVAAKVDYVDTSDSAVVLTHPVNWHAQAPLLHNGVPLQLIHAEGDKVWLDSCQDIQPGDEITQKRLVGTLPELFQAFESQWTALWNRHAAVPESQWHQILEFAKAQLRPVSVCPPVYDVQSVKRTLQRKSKYAATSLDGVSRHDLLTLPEHDLRVLCKVYNQAMTSAMSGLWQKYQTPAKWDISSDHGVFQHISNLVLYCCSTLAPCNQSSG